MAVTITQIDFNRPPEQWGGELYEIINALVKDNNRLSVEMDDVSEKLDLYESYFKKLGTEISDLQ